MSHKRFKKINAVITITVLCTALSACSNAQSADQQPSAETPVVEVQQDEPAEETPAEEDITPIMATTSDIEEDAYMRSTTIYSYIDRLSDDTILKTINKAIEKHLSDVRTSIYASLRISASTNAANALNGENTDTASSDASDSSQQGTDTVMDGSTGDITQVTLSVEGTAIYLDSDFLSYRIQGTAENDAVLAQLQYLNFDLASGQELKLFDIIPETDVYDAFQNAYLETYQAPMNERIFDYWDIDSAFCFKSRNTLEVTAPAYYLSYEQTVPMTIDIDTEALEVKALPKIGYPIGYALETNYSDAFNLDYCYPVLLYSGVDGSASIQNELMGINTDIKAQIDESMNYNIALAIEDHTSEPVDDYVWPPYYYTCNFDTFMNTEKYLSLGLTYYQYTGGAHGLTTATFFNYDMRTGMPLVLSDLFEKDFDYTTYINDIIYKAIDDMGYDGTGFSFEGISETQKFYLEDDTIVIYFDPYEIAPYAAGTPTFKIPFPSHLES